MHKNYLTNLLHNISPKQKKIIIISCVLLFVAAILILSFNQDNTTPSDASVSTVDPTLEPEEYNTGTGYASRSDDLKAYFPYTEYSTLNDEQDIAFFIDANQALDQIIVMLSDCNNHVDRHLAQQYIRSTPIDTTKYQVVFQDYEHATPCPDN